MTNLAPNRTIIVTGGGQGVGQGIALAFAAGGDSVVLAGRTLSKLEETAKIISDRGVGRAHCVACDIKDAASLANLVEETIRTFGAIDVLVNNAQEVPLGLLEDVTDESYTAGFESGPLATLRLMKLVRPHLAKQGGGTIINLVSSAMKRWDMTGYGAYAAVKQAIQALTRAAAAEWGSENIRALAIAPHALSQGLKRWIENNPEESAAFFKTIPLGYVGECEDDIGKAVVALCAPEMRYLNGATVPLDGGQANFG